MWDAVIAGATGLVGLYVALRQEVRRSHELLSQRIDHLDSRLSGRIDHLDSRLSGRIDHLDEGLGGRIDHVDTGLGGRIGGLEASLVEVRADLRRLDQKVDDVRGELISFLGPRQA